MSNLQTKVNKDGYQMYLDPKTGEGKNFVYHYFSQTMIAKSGVKWSAIVVSLSFQK